MYEWSWGIFAKKTKFHSAGGPGTMVLPTHSWFIIVCYSLYLHGEGEVEFYEYGDKCV